jgi:site-specific DNA-methyltransferase (adenine-specific)
LRLNTIINEDAIDGMRKMSDNCIDLAITSPMYNLGVKYEACTDWMTWDDYYDWCRVWMKEIYRILKPDGRFCLNHYLSCGTAAHRSAPLMNLNAICELELGFKHHGFALWTESSTVKRTAWGSFLSASAPYISSPHEGIDILYKDRWKKDRKGVSTVTKKEFFEGTLGIWKIPPEKKRKGCPAPFPLGLPLRCINLLSYVGDTVFDPFMGSATTAVAAKMSGRNYFGFEISKQYFDEGNQRLEETRTPDVIE